MNTLLTITFGFLCSIIGYIVAERKHKNDFDTGYNTALNDFSNNIKVEPITTPQEFLHEWEDFLDTVEDEE